MVLFDPPDRMQNVIDTRSGEVWFSGMTYRYRGWRALWQAVRPAPDLQAWPSLDGRAEFRVFLRQAEPVAGERRWSPWLPSEVAARRWRDEQLAQAGPPQHQDVRNERVAALVSARGSALSVAGLHALQRSCIDLLGLAPTLGLNGDAAASASAG